MNNFYLLTFMMVVLVGLVFFIMGYHFNKNIKYINKYIYKDEEDKSTKFITSVAQVTAWDLSETQKLFTGVTLIPQEIIKVNDIPNGSLQKVFYHNSIELDIHDVEWCIEKPDGLLFNIKVLMEAQICSRENDEIGLFKYIIPKCIILKDGGPIINLTSLQEQDEIDKCFHYYGFLYIKETFH